MSTYKNSAIETTGRSSVGLAEVILRVNPVARERTATSVRSMEETRQQWPPPY